MRTLKDAPHGSPDSKSGKAAVRVATDKISFDHLLDNGSEESVLFLETSLILRKESIEIMK